MRCGPGSRAHWPRHRRDRSGVAPRGIGEAGVPGAVRWTVKARITALIGAVTFVTRGARHGHKPPAPESRAADSAEEKTLKHEGGENTKRRRGRLPHEVEDEARATAQRRTRHGRRRDRERPQRRRCPHRQGDRDPAAGNANSFSGTAGSFSQTRKVVQHAPTRTV